jgi:hypothetical protein
MHGGNEITFAAIDKYPQCSTQRFVFDTPVATVRRKGLQARMAKQAAKIRDRVS